MKQPKRLLLALLAAVGSLCANAYDFKVDGIYYNKLTATTCEVTSSSGYYYSGSVVIPSLVNVSGRYYSVTAIGGSAFYNCKSLTSVEIPNSVTTIGSSAFYGCSSLKSVKINDLSAWCKIDFANSAANPLYYAHNLYLQGALVKKLKIPNSVTAIGNYTFYGCSSLTSVEIPNSVTSIGGYAFEGCSSLTSVEIPNSITTIEVSTFYGCSSLTSVEIPNSVTSIGGYAFYGCSSLTSVEIPNSVTSIGDYTFYGCSSLTAVEIPNSVTSIGKWAFSSCSILTSVEIPNSITTIETRTFYGCSSLTSVKIPASVTTIGSNAFYGCENLTEIISLNPTPPAVGTTPFLYVPNFKCVLKVPTQSVELYKAAEGWECFFNIVGIAIEEEGKNDDEEERDEFEVAGIYYNVLSKEDMTVEVVHNDTYTGDIVIPATVEHESNHYSVTTIKAGAFKECAGLTSVEIPISVTVIEKSAFSGCTCLEAFYGEFSSEDHRCLIADGALIAFAPAGLTTYIIPASVTMIEEDTFNGCSALNELTISKNVQRMGSRAFAGCSGLTEIKCLAKVPPIAEADTFEGINNTGCMVLVPLQAVSLYKSARGWDSFKYIQGVNTGMDADVNNDGVIDVADVVSVYNQMAEDR